MVSLGPGECEGSTAQFKHSLSLLPAQGKRCRIGNSLSVTSGTSTEHARSRMEPCSF